MVNSINTNIASYFAQSNISKASDLATSSVARLSSGQRIVKASDDVAGLSIGTGLRTNVTTLKAALTNASQATSLLQVADGALSQVTELLQRQKSLASTAASGQLTNTDRGYLQQEFSALTAEINRISGSTNFNGVELINGALSSAAGVTSNATRATGGELRVSFDAPIETGEAVIINGIQLVADATGTNLTFASSGNLATTIDNLVVTLNNLANDATSGNSLGEAIYSRDGNSLVIKSRTGGAISNNFRVQTNAVQYSTPSTYNFQTIGTNADLQINFAAPISGFAVGQSITINSAAVSPGGTAFAAGTYIINEVGSNYVAVSTTINTTGNGTGTAAANGADRVYANVATYRSSTASNEANVDGGFSGTTFNLFSTSGATTATTQISASGAAAGTPFQNGNSITALIDGVTRNVYTFTGNTTIQGLVDGINANTASGFKAALIYDGTNYNVRMTFNGNPTAIELDYGANFYTTASDDQYVVGGFGVAASGTNGARVQVGSAAGTTASKAIFASNSIDYLGTAIGATSDAGDAVGSIADEPFAIGSVLAVRVNNQLQNLFTPTASGTTFREIVDGINANTATTGVYAVLTTGTAGASNIENIRLFVNVGSASDRVTVVNNGVALGGNTVATTRVAAAETGGLTRTSTLGLAGGSDNGLYAGGVSVSGSVGGNILTELKQTKASSSLIFTSLPTAGNTIVIGSTTFRFSANASRAANEVLIGSTISETIDNAISTIEAYRKNSASPAEAFQLSQIDVARSGNSLNLTGRSAGNVLDVDGSTAVGTTISGSFGAFTSANLSNSSIGGVNVFGVVNKDFNGSIQGFKANYRSTDTVDISIKIGDFTYSANSVNVVSSTDKTIRLYSDTVGGTSGGYFDIILDGGNVSTFGNQSGADDVASRLNIAFSGLSFRQERQVDSYKGTQGINVNGTVIGSLVGTTFTAQIADFDNLRLGDVKVLAPTGSASDLSVTFTINGTNYRSQAGVGTKLGLNQTIRFVSENDATQYLEFTNGSSAAITIDTADKAIAFEKALKEAFGATSGSAALSFQVGTLATDSLSVSIGSATTRDLYVGSELDIGTQAGAIAASTVLDKALVTVTSIRADVGALQSRFNFASANLQNSIQNQDAARATLLDTDVATESTAYATAQVQLQAGISVLAQANQQLQALLKLIG